MFMRDTLNGMLSMQKIEEGHLQLELAPFSFANMISGAVVAFQSALSSKHLKVATSISKLVPALVVGDYHRIQHVFSNFLSNAVKFSFDGATIYVDVSLGASGLLPANHVSIVTSVRDEGCGVSDNDQHLLFDKWMQVHPSSRQAESGSGLGLNICKEVVRMHGGTISVESVLKKGSTFSFTIPFEIAQNSIEETAAPISKIYQAARVPRGTRILIVDDSNSNRTLLSRLLEREQIPHKTAENGLQAVHEVQKASEADLFNLILMDGEMPIMNGLTATAELRERGYPYIIVGLTGNALEDDISRFLNAGADCVMPKPFEFSKFDKLLQYIALDGFLSKAPMVLEIQHGEYTWVSRGA